MSIYNNILKNSLILGIRFYQKFISPYKGFQCSHKAHTYGMSCSGYGMLVVNKHNPFTAISLIRQRLKACSVINKLYMRKLHMNSQTGACDAPDCDLPHCDTSDCSNKTSFCNCLDFASCDLFSKEKSNSTQRNFINKKPKNKKTTVTKLSTHFLLLDEFEEENLYQHITSEKFYLIKKDLNEVNEEEILSNNSLNSKELSAEEVKVLFENKKDKP